jgi:hypothetical protein
LPFIMLRDFVGVADCLQCELVADVGHGVILSSS